MRILFTAVPAYGHLLPLLPLARAAHAAGDDVLVSTHAALASTAADLPFTPSGSALPDLLAQTTRRREGRLTLRHTDFAEIAEFFVDTRLDLDLASIYAVAEAHRPDLIVGDVVDFCHADGRRGAGRTVGCARHVHRAAAAGRAGLRRGAGAPVPGARRSAGAACRPRRRGRSFLRASVSAVWAAGWDRKPLRFICRRLPSAAGGRSMVNIQRVWPRAN
ncbi:hypothetical protein GCM10022251_73770 [Phytohabitans flavus]|uniref:Glycosyltransferase family 28 N-terminal domain-containing protein n=1 Tax=Phytohabitans flavus TaxID=1076124 RepID=A0A6F8XKW5_9ACTN|nr:hypothetical protein [Phytohabitans flavus]BCB74455.1 hypothetical protein Pflav_008650 [Phytohabitans flavus]